MPSLTIYVPTCLSKELVNLKNRSESFRVLLGDFFDENMERLKQFSCAKPDMKVFSICIEEYRPILDELVEAKIFISRSEALRFVMLYTFLRGDNLDDVDMDYRRDKVLDNLDYENWKSVDEINELIGNENHRNYIYFLLYKAWRKGILQRKHQHIPIGRPITLWRKKQL